MYKSVCMFSSYIVFIVVCVFISYNRQLYLNKQPIESDKRLLYIVRDICTLYKKFLWEKLDIYLKRKNNLVVYFEGQRIWVNSLVYNK